MAFGDALLEGQFSFGEEKIYYASGVNIVRFPAEGTLHAAPVADKAHVGKRASNFELQLHCKPCQIDNAGKIRTARAEVLSEIR